LRRRRASERADPRYAAFMQVIEVLERGKHALTEVVPTGRVPGRPFGEALYVFEDSLLEASSLMAAWNEKEDAERWVGCNVALSAALEACRRLREDAPELGGFEGLVGVIGELIALLDPFEDAERALGPKAARN
jgi:hypothetical protein